MNQTDIVLVGGLPTYKYRFSIEFGQLWETHYKGSCRQIDMNILHNIFDTLNIYTGNLCPEIVKYVKDIRGTNTHQKAYDNNSPVMYSIYNYEHTTDGDNIYRRNIHDRPIYSSGGNGKFHRTKLTDGEVYLLTGEFTKDVKDVIKRVRREFNLNALV